MRRVALALLLSASGPAFARGARPDDSDLSGRTFSPLSAGRLASEGRREGRAWIFKTVPASGTRETAGPGAVSGRLVLTDRAGADKPGRMATAALLASDGAKLDEAETGADGSWSLRVPADVRGPLRVRLSLANRFWRFQSPDGRTYEWESPPFSAPPEGADLGALKPAPGSENAKVGAAQQTYVEMIDYLNAQRVGLAWWKRTLPVNWPADADYFSPWNFELNITNPSAWDVILHEMGHSVMAQAMRAEPAGGRHKIDECYSPALAWSEGWATFFAAAARLDPSDPDAKFEYLVPRRAPIRIENVPDDVCKGESSEWRVASALWDLLDSHDDGGDRVAIPFKTLWAAWEGQAMGSLTGYFALLQPSLDAETAARARTALEWNTIQPAALALRSRPWPKIPLRALDAAPSWDGRKP